MRLLGCDITQLYVFLLFAALGAVLGGVYLLLYMLTRHGGFWAVFADVAFGCAAVAAVCVVNLLFQQRRGSPVCAAGACLRRVRFGCNFVQAA